MFFLKVNSIEGVPGDATEGDQAAAVAEEEYQEDTGVWYLDSVLSWIFIQLTSLEVSRIMGEVALSSCKSCQQDRGGESSARVHTSLVRHQQLGGSSYIAGLPAFAVMGQ